MSTTDEKKYAVLSLPLNHWDDDYTVELADAETQARIRSFRNGTEYGIFKMIAKTTPPSIINDVKITAVQ